MDVVDLSRLQFALTIMFHYLFPPLSIGLGWMLVFHEAMYLRTKDPHYETTARFWTKLFAVNFAMGVATGIVMEFQFGTNWSNYSRFVGDVFGSALAAEGIFAFFLESGFLAVLVFGWDRVSARMHFFATLMVAIGATFSAVWIIVANSWMQTPAGFHIVQTAVGPRAEITDFWAVVFNPSSMVRLTHTLLGALILGAFFVTSISAWYLLKGRFVESARKTFLVGLVAASIFSLVQVFAGHWSAVVVARYQPAKLAAFEGQYETGAYAPLHLFGITRADGVDGVAIPGLLSWLVHFDASQPIQGLREFYPHIPPVAISFQSYHLMVALGMFMIALTWLALFFHWRGTLFQQRWLLGTFVVAVAAPYLSNQAGWVAAEVGRQPWIVYPVPALGFPGMLTRDSASPSVSAGEVMASIVIFGLIYLCLLAVYLYVLNDKIQHGPSEPVHMPEHDRTRDLLDVAARRTDDAGDSMTEAHTPHPTAEGPERAAPLETGPDETTEPPLDEAADGKPTDAGEEG